MSHNEKRENFRTFYESVGEHYPEEDVVYRTLRGAVRQKFVLSHIASFSGTLLDLGCNRGAYLAQCVSAKKIGVDISLPVLRKARKRTAAHFIQGDAQALGFLRSETVDYILCSEMIEHVPDPEAVLSECWRILRNGGSLLITTPNYRRQKPTWVSIGEMAGYGIRGVEGDLYFHTAFRPGELSGMAFKAGFRSAEAGTFEKEVIYATRLPVVLYHTINWINKATGGNATVERMNSRMLDRLSFMIYRLAAASGLNPILCKLVKEGTRTFLFAKK